MFLFQADDGIRDAHLCLAFRLVLFRSKNVSLPARWARKSSFNAANCPGDIGLLVLPHQMVLSVWASRTVNLSCADRPVCLPVSTTSGPSLANMPSPRFPASSTRGAVARFLCIAAPRSEDRRVGK